MAYTRTLFNTTGSAIPVPELGGISVPATDSLDITGLFEDSEIKKALKDGAAALMAVSFYLQLDDEGATYNIDSALKAEAWYNTATPLIVSMSNAIHGHADNEGGSVLALYGALADDEAVTGDWNFTGGLNINGNDVATEAYVQNAIAGLDWQESVLSEVTAPVGGESGGERYLVIATATGAFAGKEDQIAQHNGVGWDFIVPNDGHATWIEDTDILKVYNGSAWIQWGSINTHTHAHNDMTSKDGGSGSEFYHMTLAQHTAATRDATNGQNGLCPTAHIGNADAHHAESHNIASHSDTSATGTELNTLTDGSDAGALHSHDNVYYLKTAFLNISSGASDAGKPVVLNASGLIDSTMLPTNPTSTMLLPFGRGGNINNNVYMEFAGVANSDSSPVIGRDFTITGITVRSSENVTGNNVVFHVYDGDATTSLTSVTLASGSQEATSMALSVNGGAADSLRVYVNRGAGGAVKNPILILEIEYR